MTPRLPLGLGLGWRVLGSNENKYFHSDLVRENALFFAGLHCKHGTNLHEFPSSYSTNQDKQNGGTIQRAGFLVSVLLCT